MPRGLPRNRLPKVGVPSQRPPPRLEIETQERLMDMGRELQGEGWREVEGEGDGEAVLWKNEAPGQGHQRD
jgi:hypothetical protein